MNKEKIEKLIEKIIKDKDRIQSVKREFDEFESREEYYFSYPDTKYFWSVSKDSIGDYDIFYYPERYIRSNFIRFGKEELSNTSLENLKSLFEILRSKLYGFDSVLNDILG